MISFERIYSVIAQHPEHFKQASQNEHYFEQHPNLKLWNLFNHEDITKHLGYVILDYSPDGYAIPYWCINPEYSVEHLLRSFTEFYIRMADRPLASVQNSDNTLIKSINSEMGWRIEGTAGGLDALYHPGYKSLLPADEILIYQAVRKLHGLEN